MPIQRAKPLADLYDEVAGYDLVLVPDAPVASALTRRLDRPHFGTFATTPRRLAAGRRETAEDRTAFLEIIETLDDHWKAVAYAIGNVLQCWEHQTSASAVLEYDRFADSTTEHVVDLLTDLETTSGQLTEYTVADDVDLAVVGERQFTQLERSILPESYDSFSLFVDEPFDQPPFNIFDSPAAILDALLDTTDEETAEDIAVVLDNGSQYSSLVESTLEAEGIPYYGGPGFIDDGDHRALLRLLRHAQRGSGTTVADVKPVLTQCGINVGIKHDGKRLDAVDIPELDWIQDCCGSISDQTFGDVIEQYESQRARTLDAFRDELSALGLLETTVTEQTLQQLEYYLDTYEVPIDRENEGVLLADAKSAGYVDRPVVFFLGMDEGWTHSAPQRPWVDTEAQFDRYIRQFKRLLQSGSEQYYLVQDTAGGQPVTPCLYFNELLDDEFERFSDLPSVSYDRTPSTAGSGFERESLDISVDAAPVSTISQSSLNTYVNSPRDYLFSTLLDSPDADYFTEGNLFHDFAEFYVNHPDVVDEAMLDEVVDTMVEEVRPFYADSDEILRERRYRIGLETIIEYLDTNPPEPTDFVTSTGGWQTNTFAELFDRPVDSPNTERWFEDEILGLKGLIDLVYSPAHLLDYKSGRKKSASKVVKHSAIDPPNDTVNYQALLYLTYYRTVTPDEPLEFTFFHFLENMDAVIQGTADLSETLTTVSYYPYTFDEYVGTRDAYEVLLDGYNDCVATFENLGYDRYAEILDELTFPETTEKDELRASDFAQQFTGAVDSATADSVDAEKGCDQAIRALNGVRRQTYFSGDLDRFESFVDERLDELNHRRAGGERFPVDGLGGEPNYRRVDHRDLLLEGGR